jgi:hypothetical protein
MYAVRRLLMLLPFCALLLPFARAQQPNLEPNTPVDKPVPTVTFDFLFPGATPSHYAISVESSGKAAYRSDEVGPEGKSEPNAGEPYLVKFVVSGSPRERIFEFARQANYFKGSFDFTKHRVANTGAKTLTYSEGPAVAGGVTSGMRNSTSYNYSENPAIQQLTNIFQSISNTLELGARLSFLRRFDKLGLDAELKRAGQMARDNQLLELHAIEPALRAVANDTRVMNLARQEAKDLLAIANGTANGGSQP